MGGSGSNSEESGIHHQQVHTNFAVFKWACWVCNAESLGDKKKEKNKREKGGREGVFAENLKEVELQDKAMVS